MWMLDTKHPLNHGELVVLLLVFHVFVVAELTVRVKERSETCVEVVECLLRIKLIVDGIERST
jgi:hypothetical protein